MKNISYKIIMLIGSLFLTLSAFSQNWNLVWREDFGVAEDTVIKNFADNTKTVPRHFFAEYESVPHYNSMGNIDYHEAGQYLGECATISDGSYGITNNVRWAYKRFASCKTDGGEHFVASKDHTGNKNGAMLVVNSEVGTGLPIYEQEIDFSLCDSREYKFVIYAASVTAYQDGGNANLELQVINKETGEEINTIKTGDIPFWPFDGWGEGKGEKGDVTATREWSEYSCTFTVNNGGTLLLRVINWGSGYNDFAIDDISLYRNDDVNVIEPVISSNTISEESTSIGSDCQFIASFKVPIEVLTSWKNIYDQVYFLWQRSTDDGFTWSNILSESGIEKRSVELEVSSEKPEVYRVIITGASTVALAEEQALYIAEHGGPKDGCSYFSISNTLAGVSPTPDCSFKEDLRTVWKENFGRIDSTEVRDFEGTSFSLYDKPTKEGVVAGNYAVTCAPDAALLKANYSWDGSISGYSASGKDMSKYMTDANNAFFYAVLPQEKNVTGETIVIDKVLSGPFCNCKNYLFSYRVICPNSWTTVELEARVMDGTRVIASQLAKLSGTGTPSWTRMMTSFSLPINYAGALHLQVVAKNDNTWDVPLAIDDLSLAICSETIGEASLGIDGDDSLFSYGPFDCNDHLEKHFVQLFAPDWDEEGTYYIGWQTSSDGVNWKRINGSSRKVDYDNPEGGLLMYRAILSKSETVVNEIAEKGASTDPCDTYLITDPVSITCKKSGCRKPELDFKFGPGSTLCESEAGKPFHAFQFEQTNSVKIDSVIWFSKSLTESKWTKVDSQNNPEQLSHTIAIPTETTQYLYMAASFSEDSICVSDSMIYTLNIAPKPELSLGADKESICYGSSVKLTAKGKNASSLLWIYDEETVKETPNPSSVIEEDLTYSPEKSGRFFLFAPSEGACPDTYSDTIQIEVEMPMDYTITPIPTAICAGNSIDLTATKIAGDALSEVWTKNGDVISTTTDIPTENTTYVFTATGNICPEFIKSFDITVETASDLSITPSKTIACSGEEIELIADLGFDESLSSSVTAATPTSSIEWQYSIDGTEFKTFATGSEEVKSFPIGNYSKYYFKLKTAGSGTCPIVFSPTAMVEVEAPLSVTWTDIDKVCAGTEIEFVFNGMTQEELDNHTFSWKKDGVEFDTNLETSFFVTESAEYEIRITGTACPDIVHTYSIEAQQPAELNISANKEKICAGESIDLTIDYGTASSLVWIAVPLDDTDRDEFSTELTTTKSVTPSKTTMYWIEAPGDEICPNTAYSDFLMIEVQEPIDFTVEEVQPVICDGTSVELKATQTSGIPNQITWEKNGEFLSSEYSLTDIPTAQTTYELTITGDACPKKSHTFVVDIEKADQLSLTASKDEVCASNQVTLSATYGESNLLEWEVSTDNGITYTSFSTELTEQQIVSPQTTSLYRLKTKGEACPQVFSESITIAVEESIDVELETNSQTICEGSSIELKATQTSGKDNVIVWKRNGVEFANALNTTDTPTETTKYQLTVSGKVCKPINESVTIKVEKKPSIDLKVSAEGICDGGDLELRVNYEDCEGIAWQRKYISETEYTTFSTFMGSVYPDKPKETATYRIISTDNEVCEAVSSEEKTVVVEKYGRLNLPTDILKICPNTEAKIEITHNGIEKELFSYDVDIASPTRLEWGVGRVFLYIAPQQETNLTVGVSHKYCEQNKESMTIQIDEIPTLDINLNGVDRICEGNNVALSSSFENPASIVWSAKRSNQSDYETFAIGVNEVAHTPSETTIYKISGSNANNCPAEDVYATVVVDKKATFNTHDQVICEGDSTLLILSDLSNHTSIKWSASDGNAINGEAVVMVTPTQTTTYNVEVENGECTTEGAIEVKVVSAPHIIACEEISNKTYQITAESELSPLSYDWGDGRGQTDSNIKEDIVYGKKYNIIVSNEVCSTTYDLETPVYDIYIPEYFIPEEEASWNIQNLDRYNGATVQIFDRYGKKIAEWDENDPNGWDGTYNGHAMPSTDYWYVLHIAEIDRIYNGHFTLIR